MCPFYWAWLWAISWLALLNLYFNSRIMSNSISFSRTWKTASNIIICVRNILETFWLATIINKRWRLPKCIRGYFIEIVWWRLFAFFLSAGSSHCWVGWWFLLRALWCRSIDCWNFSWCIQVGGYCRWDAFADINLFNRVLRVFDNAIMAVFGNKILFTFKTTIEFNWI